MRNCNWDDAGVWDVGKHIITHYCYLYQVTVRNYWVLPRCNKGFPYLIPGIKLKLLANYRETGNMFWLIGIM